MDQGSPRFPVFRALSRSLHHHSSVAIRPPSHHPSSITTASLVPVPHWLPPSHPSGHTVLIHSFHMPKPSQYPMICSTRYSLSIPALLCWNRISSYNWKGKKQNYIQNLKLFGEKIVRSVSWIPKILNYKNIIIWNISCSFNQFPVDDNYI